MSSNKGYKAAIELLYKVSTPHGFTAAPAEEDNYKRVWTRDSVICGMAALLTGDEKLERTCKQSLQTIWQNQHAVGFIPSNVDVKEGTVSYGGVVGRADTVSWAIIGLCIYAIHTDDMQFARKYSSRVDQAFQLMDAWEFNGRHLMYIPQSADWADEYIYHGYVLLEQLLRMWALQLAAAVFEYKPYAYKASQLKEVIRNNFFKRDSDEGWYAPVIARNRHTAPSDFWWMAFNPGGIYPQFDLQANTFALLLGIGSGDQDSILLDYLRKRISATEGMLPSFDPPVQPGDHDYTTLEQNYAYRFRNKPGEFHNGGNWPVWNGWLCAALEFQHEKPAKKVVHNNMLMAVQQEGNGMHEYYTGTGNLPGGVKECAWSAAGIILAEKGHQLFT